MARDTPKLKESEPSSATGGGVQAKPPFWSVFSESNQRVSCCPTLLQAAKDSHPKCVAWHLNQGGCLPKLLRHQYARVPRPLQEAAGAKPTGDGHRTPPCALCVETMIAAGLKSSWLDEGGRSPLERAAMVGCVPCIETLLRSPTCAKADAICDQLSTALVEAVKINSEASVRALLVPTSASFDPLTSESRLGPALIEAVKARAYDCITPLVEAGAVLNPVLDASDGSYRSAAPLIKAADGEGTTDNQKDDRASDIIRLLVKLGAVVNPSRGRSALHVAASKGRCGCMQVLLELGADPMALDNRGNSPLHLTASSHHAEGCRLLVKHITEASGAAAGMAALLAKNTQDRSPLYLAVSSCWVSSPKVALCVSMLVRLLEASGGAQAVARAFREKVGEKGRTLVHFAAENRRVVDCLKALTAEPEGLRVALEVEDDDGTSPIALAQQLGHDFDDIPAFTQVPYVPCCSGLVEATEKGHVVCVKCILKDSYPQLEAAGTAEGKALDPLASSISHDGHTCSKIVRLLLEAGFHPDGRHGDFVPLRNAAGVNEADGICQECTRLLIEAGAGGLFCRWNRYGDDAMWYILYNASICGNDGQSTHLAKAALAACDIGDDEHGVTDLCDWAGGRSTELPRLLADAGADVTARKKSNSRRTALHMAAGLLDLDDYDEEDDLPDSDQHVELVGWLVSKGALVDARDGTGSTPMHIAVSQGYRNVVATLLDLGADPLLRSASGENSLHMAAYAGCTTLIARFIDLGIDVNARADEGTTALHVVSQRGHASCVRMLVDEGADINNKDDCGWTPLRYAASHDKAKALECLLDYGKGDLRETLHGVGNLLHTATYHGSTAAMQLLVNRGLDVASTVVSNGETVMHKAAQNGGEQSVKWLLANGASLDVQGHDGRKLQTSAIMEGTCDRKVQSALKAIAESEGGKRSMSVEWNGWSLLHWASAKGFEQCARFVVSKGGGVDSKTTDDEEESAMHCAVRHNRKKVVRVLAKSGACMDARDSSGRTPMHLAAAADDHLQIAITLLELGASCNIADNNGRTPLWAAAKQGNLACCSLLVARGADMAPRDIHGKNALGASLVGSHSTKTNREEVVKLLIGLGCPVGELEVDEASRGLLTASFAKTVMACMSEGTSARELIKATSMAYSPSDASGNPAVSMMTVRVSSEPPPTFSSRGHRISSASEVVTSSKVYLVDGLRLRQAVSHLEGPDEAGKCHLLKLLLPPPAGWAAVYRDASGARASGSSTGFASFQVERPVERPGSIPSDAVLPSYRGPRTPLTSEVELSCNGDDFDEAGFEAVLEYLSTGQVVGATCGNIHGDGSAPGNGAPHEVGKHAVASHRAAAFFGLPHLQSMVRAWLRANGAEMENDGTGVLSEPAEGSSGDGSKKRKFAG